VAGGIAGQRVGEFRGRRQSTKRFHHSTPAHAALPSAAAADGLDAVRHEVYAWSEMVDALDLRPICQTYASLRGQPPYDPRVVKILVYGYAWGLRSSRQPARACVEDRTVRMLTGNLQPDFTTIAEFRRRPLQSLGALLVESVRLAEEAGLVKGREVAIDETKIQANASKHRAMSYGRMTEEVERLEQDITEYLRTLEATDQAEDAAHGRTADGRSVPEALADAERRRATIQAAKARWEGETQARAETAGTPAPRRTAAAGSDGPEQLHQPRCSHHAPCRQGVHPRLQRPSGGRYRAPSAAVDCSLVSLAFALMSSVLRRIPPPFATGR
jgi:transposase